MMTLPQARRVFDKVKTSLWLVSSLQRGMGSQYDVSNQDYSENEHKQEWVFNVHLLGGSSSLDIHIVVKTIVLGSLHSRVFSRGWCVDAYALLSVLIATSNRELEATSHTFDAGTLLFVRLHY